MVGFYIRLFNSFNIVGEKLTCPIMATLFDSLTSDPMRMNPAQFAGCWNCLVVWTVVMASARALLTLAPWRSEE